MPTSDELNRTGAQYHLSGDLESAKMYYRAALEIDPLDARPLLNLVPLLDSNKELSTGLAIARRANALIPDNPTILGYIGNMLFRLGHFADALCMLRRASELGPDNVHVWHNLALCYHRVGEPILAQSSIDRMKALGHYTPAVQNDEAHIKLASSGSLHEALELYENRWESLIHLPPWDFYIQEWKGENLVGKTILVHGEQGMGDTIMTIRFAKILNEFGANVILAVPETLIPLLNVQDWCKGFEFVNVGDEVALSELAPRVDFHSPMYSVMRHLGVEWPDIHPAPYLAAPRLSTAKVDGRQFNVGICWASGSRGTELDWRQRYIPLDLWLPLAHDPKVQLYSLQMGKEADDIGAISADGLVRNYAARFTDWAATAAFVNKLDLVIAVDTAIIHLSGAMGKPTWMISQYSNCWRWKDIKNGSGRPWYDTVDVFHQKDQNDWSEVMSQVALALAQSVPQSKLMAAE